MTEFVEILIVVLTSSIKHTFAGIPTGYLLKFNYVEVMLYTALGGAMGILFFMYFAAGTKKLYLYYLKRRGITPRKFTRMNRFIVRVKQRFGLIGIAFITPPLMSVPIGAVVAATIYKDKRKAFLFLLGGVVFWSVVGSSVVPLANLIAAVR